MNDDTVSHERIGPASGDLLDAKPVKASPVTPIDITRLLWLCYVHGGSHPDLPSEALGSLRKFPRLVTITEPDDNRMRPCYHAEITDEGRVSGNQMSLRR